MSSVYPSNKASDPVYRFMKKKSMIAFHILGFIVGKYVIENKNSITLFSWPPLAFLQNLLHALGVKLRSTFDILYVGCIRKK
jgi:hypothetical protein